MALKAVPPEKQQLTQVISINRMIEKTSRSRLGRFAFLSERFRICKYVLYANIRKNMPAIGRHSEKRVDGGWVLTISQRFEENPKKFSSNDVHRDRGRRRPPMKMRANSTGTPIICAEDIHIC